MAVAPPAGGADRQDHRQTQRHREGEVELGADIGIMVAASIRRLRRHEPAEDRGPDVAQEERRRADFGEADRGEVYLAGQLGEAPGLDLVDRETREAFHFAVAFDGPVIDVIVAEGAEVEGGQWAGSETTRGAGVRVDPHRAIREGKGDAV